MKSCVMVRQESILHYSIRDSLHLKRWTKYSCFIVSLLLSTLCTGQTFDTAKYSVTVEYSHELESYFAKDNVWRGADGASSVDLENGKVLWLFSDSFICSDSTHSRKTSTFIRNSIAIQDGYDIKTAPVKYYWNKSNRTPQSFFSKEIQSWFWTGHGIMIKDKLLIFLMKVHEVKSGLGFEIFGWNAVLISNPYAEPTQWEMQYITGPETHGTIAGSAAVLKDDQYIYAYGAVEPTTHEVHVLRWKIDDAYRGNIANPEWWIEGNWAERTAKHPTPIPLFIGSTEFSVHYDTTLNSYVQIQSFGFGEGKIGIRMSDSVQGKWTEPYIFYAPEYPGIKSPIMYSAKAHPELTGEGMYITYNVNSLELSELIENETIYFPKFIQMKIEEKRVH